MAAELGAVLAALEDELGAPEGEPEPLDGGITNRNVRVRLRGRDCVIRLPGSGTALLGIDRGTERAATVAAAARASGRTWSPPRRPRLPRDGVRRGRGAGRGGAARAGPDRAGGRGPAPVHAGPPLDRRFDAFEIVERYKHLAEERAAAPRRLRRARRRRGRHPRRARRPGARPVPCHNDLLRANFIDDGTRLRILTGSTRGWATATSTSPTCPSTTGYAEDDDERLLAAYWEEPCTPRRFAALRLMRVMSDFREAMWGTVQAVLSELDFDFAGYAAEHGARVRRALDDPRIPRWLEDARDRPA